MSSMLASQVISTCLLLLLRHCATACTDTVYIGTQDGQVAKSKDAGDTWSTELNNGGIPYHSVSADGPNVYAVARYGLAVSHNGGDLWSIKPFWNGLDFDPRVASVSVCNKRVYALIGSSNSWRVAISSDNGETWPTNFPLPTPPFGYPNNIYIDGPRIYIASDDGLGYTDDLGESWKFKNESSGLASNTNICMISRGQSIYVATAGEQGALLSASQDGGRTLKNANITLSGFSGDSMYLLGDTLYVSTIGGLSWSNDFTTWTTKTTADGLAESTTVVITGSGKNLYLGTYSGGLSISRDNGQTWNTKTTNDGLPSNRITAAFAQCV